MLRDLKWFDSLKKRDFENGAVINEIRDVFKAAQNNGSQAAQTNNNRVMPCPAYIHGNVCVVSRTKNCWNEPCNLSRVRT